MAIILSSDQLELLRGRHKTRLYLSIARPSSAMLCEVNGSPATGEIDVPFDNGSLVASFDYIDIQDMVGCEVWVGTSAGSDNLGRVRMRAISSGDGGATGTLTVSANNIQWVDNAHITIKLDFRMRPRFPRIDVGTETFYKEWGELAYSDENEEPPPVTLAGTHMAYMTDGAPPFVGIVSIDMSGSYPVAAGASIDTYDAYALSDQGGVFIGMTPTPTPTGVLAVGTYGQAWLRARCVDSNGKEQVTWRYIATHSSDPSSPYFPITEFDGVSITGSWEEGGWKASLTLRNPDDTQFDDGALCVLWAETDYAGSDEVVTLLPGTTDDPPRNNTILIAGYIRRATVDQDRNTGEAGLPVEITTIESVMRQHYQFSVSLEVVPSAPDTWWKYASWMTTARAVHHFWKWHTNVLELCDVIGINADTLPRAYAEIEDGTFYTMPDDLMRNRGIRCHVCADKGGRIHIAPEIQLLRDAERDALDTVFHIAEDDTSGLISLSYTPENEIPFVEVSGFSFGGLFDAENNPIVTPHCAIAPGEPPDDDGPSPTTFEYQTLENQAHANALAGRYYAWRNNPWKEVRITHPGDYIRVLEPALALWFTIDLAADDTILGEKLVWEGRRLILRQVSVTFNGDIGTLVPQAVYEAEAIGPDGVPKVCPTVPDDGDDGEPGDTPEDAGLPAVITGSSAWYLPLIDQVWDLRTNEDVFSLAADPWWRVKQGSAASGDAIIIRCGDGYIKRSYDAGLTWEDITPSDPPTNCMGDTPAPVVSELRFMRHDSSWVNENRHVFLANAVSPLGDARCWVLYTDDDCATYEWVCLNSGGGTPGQGAPDSTGGQMFRGTVNETYMASGPTLRVMQRLSDTQFFFMFRFGDGVGCVVGTKNPDNTISLGTIYELDTTSTVATPIYGSCCLIDTDVVAMVYGASVLYGATATIVGTVITFSGQTLVADASADIAGAVAGTTWSSPNLCAVGGQTILFAAAGITIGITLSAHVGVYAKVITWDSGGVALQGSWSVGDSAYKFESVDAAMVDSSHAMVVTGEISGNPIASGNRSVRGVVVNVSGLVVTFGTSGQINPTNPRGGGGSVALTGTSGIVVYNPSSLYPSYAKTLTITVGSLAFSVGPAVVLSNGATNILVTAFTAHHVSAGRYLVTGAIHPNGGRAWMLDGTTELWSAETVATGHGNDMSSTHLNADDFVVSFGTGYIFAYSNGGTGAISTVEGLDIRVGRGDGDKIYVTTKNQDGNTNLLFVLDNTPAVTDTIQLTDVATERCYVETDWGDDDSIMVYGRMVMTGLGTSHIAESFNGGGSFSQYESGWGSSYCGALRIINGNVFALRNVDGEARLYVNGLYRSTIPFPAGVRPRGVVLSAGGTVFAAADTGQSVMVMMCRSPYASWADITYNHGTDAGIWAIDIL